MKTVLTLIVTLMLPPSLAANPLLGLPKASIPTDNEQTAAKIRLGQLLFNDKRLSADGSISCAVCHQPERAFSDGLPVARGIGGQAGFRNSPTVLNAAYYESFFLDGRAGSLEEQAMGPLLNPVEHGLNNEQEAVAVIRKDVEYIRQFEAVFGVGVEAITINHVVKALASYERTLISGNSRFDQYLFGRDPGKLSAEEKRGMALFRGKGNCLTCHEISWNHALFTDNRFYNIGIGADRLTANLDAVIGKANNGSDSDELALTPHQRSELGRFNVSKNPDDIGRFKTPTLRNIELTAPYMHDGSLTTLAEVIDYYDKGGNNNRYLDAKIFQLHLSSQEKADLEAFLRALTSQPTEVVSQ